jgi:SAM-dependent methyltransferase
VLDPAIESHYSTGYERSRLFPGGTPSLEFVRSMELLGRLLPAPPARLLDVGGGPGTYAAPLARRGYRVQLVDPVRLHVAQARQAARGDPAAAFTAVIGDARELPAPDQSQDAVMLFGPLYHLTGAADRQRALREAWRVLRPGGRLLAMAISRFASLLDGLYQGWLDDPLFRPIVERDLADGQHRNPDPVGRPEFFTTARGPARSKAPGSPAWPATESRARAGRCVRSGPTRNGASRSCSRPARPRRSLA